MAAGLGKGLKAGGELFKRTEPTPEGSGAKGQESKATNAQMQESAKEQKIKSAEVRKHIVMSEELYERLRRYCFDKRQKEAHVVREALDKFLTRKGF